MATITSIEGLPKYLAPNDFITNEINLKVKLTSSERLTNGYVELWIVPGTFTNLSQIRNVYGDDFHSIVGYYVEDIISGQTVVGCRPSTDCGYDDRYTWSPSGTKTVRIKLPQIDEQFFIPDLDENYNISHWTTQWEYTSVNAKNFLDEHIPYPTSQRRVPITIILDCQDPSGRQFEAIYNGNDFYFLRERLAPIINSVTVSDADLRNPKSRFGNFVIGESDVQFEMNCTLDSLDPTLTAGYNIELYQGQRYLTYGYASIDDTIKFTKENLLAFKESGAIIFSSGQATITYYIYVNDGHKTTNVNGTFVILDYVLPNISIVPNYQVAERWGEDINGNHVIMDDGENIWLSFSASVSSVNNLNSWTIKSQSFSDSGTQSDLYTIYSGVDGSDVSYEREENAVNTPTGYSTFSALHRFNFTVTVEDWFGNIAFLTGTVDKAGGYMNIEKYGVGVGMRTTADANNKKFEVAPNYKSYFRGGIYGVTDYSLGEVATGGQWINGKPIYRQVIQFENISAGRTSTTPIATIEEMSIPISISGVVNRTNGSYYTVPYRSVSDSAIACSIWITQTGGICINTGTNMSLAGGIIVVEYTKGSENIYQIGNQLHIISGVNVEQIGNALHIS